MYENGRKVSRYHRMREHKRRIKDRFLKNPYSRGIGQSYAEYLATADEEELVICGARQLPYAEQYWRIAYDTTNRKIAKQNTARAARNNWKDSLNNFSGEDWEDFEAGQEYDKLVEY